MFLFQIDSCKESVIKMPMIRGASNGSVYIQKKFSPLDRTRTSLILLKNINSLYRYQEQNPQENVRQRQQDRQKNKGPWSAKT